MCTDSQIVKRRAVLGRMSRRVVRSQRNSSSLVISTDVFLLEVAVVLIAVAAVTFIIGWHHLSRDRNKLDGS
jgi:hypothetical protein